MTVRELINKLLDMPMDKEVCILDTTDGKLDWEGTRHNIRGVELWGYKETQKVEIRYRKEE